MAAPPSSPAPTPIADDLLDRYVHAVGQYLWPAAAADVQEELAANLTAAMEEREGVLGRALEPAEVAAILKRHGHPLEVAGRYMRRPYLIGPAWLPVYWSVLKMLLGITWLVYVVVNAVALSAVQPWTLAGVMGVLARSGGLLVQVFAWVTLVFAALEWGGERFRRLKPDTQAWDPMKLPKVHPQRRAKRSGRALCELLPGVFFLAYWIAAVPHHPFLVFGPAAAFLRYAPGMERLFWPVLALAVAGLGLDVAAMGYGPQTWQRRAKGAAAKAVAAGIFFLLLKTGSWVTAQPGWEASAHAINYGIGFGLRVALVMVMLMLAGDLVRLLFDAKRRQA